MTSQQTSPEGGINHFQTTQWPLGLLSAQSRASGSKEAFAELCRLYWYPLHGFIRHRGYSPEDAEDLAQGFFLHLIECKTLIHRLWKQYTAFVREEICRTISDSAEVDAETHELCEALVAAQGWIIH